MPGARGAPAFERVPLILGFRNALGSAHRGDSFLQHSPGAGMQHTEAASQGPSPLPAKAPQFLGCFWDRKHQEHQCLGSSHSVLALAAWKREAHAKEWQSWDPSLICGSLL